MPFFILKEGKMNTDDYKKYNFSSGTYRDLEEFFRAKDKYMKEQNDDNLYWMQHWFMNVHCDFKAERVSRRLSENDLSILVDGLKEGL